MSFIWSIPLIISCYLSLGLGLQGYGLVGRDWQEFLSITLGIVAEGQTFTTLTLRVYFNEGGKGLAKIYQSSSGKVMFTWSEKTVSYKVPSQSTFEALQHYVPVTLVRNKSWHSTLAMDQWGVQFKETLSGGGREERLSKPGKLLSLILPCLCFPSSVHLCNSWKEEGGCRLHVTDLIQRASVNDSICLQVCSVVIPCLMQQWPHNYVTSGLARM